MKRDSIAVRYFQQLVFEALQNEGVSLGELAADYVVGILVDAIQAKMLESPMGGPPILAWYYKEAMESMGQMRFQALRRLGDASLFLAGFFIDYVDRSAGLNYYIDMGCNAYRAASSLANHPVLRELSDKFASIVNVLNAASRQTTLGKPLSVDQLFELYARSPGSGLWSQLAVNGAAPIIALINGRHN